MSIKFKQLIYYSSVLLLGTVLFVGIFYYEIRNAFNPNHVVVQVSSNIDLRKVKVIWFSEGIDSPKVIFNKGKETGVRYKEYGVNKFKVYYDDTLVGEFGHFKTNNWHGNQYEVRINKKKEAFEFFFQIEGPDSQMSF